MTIAEKLRKAFDSNDRAGLEVVIANIPTATRDEAPQGINIHNHGASDDLTARLAKCEAMTQDHATKLSTHDSKFADHEKRIGELEEDEDEGTKDGKTSKDNRRVKDERSEEEKTADAEREEEERKTKDEEARKEEERKTKDAEEEERKKSEDAAIEGELKEEAPEGTGDKAVKSKDSAYLVDSFSETVALAEILSPGIRIPTFDRAAEPKTSYVGICNLRRKSLQLATKDADTMRIIDSVRGRRTVDDASLLKMPCGVVRELFIASAGAKRVANNAAATHDAGHFQNLQGTGGGIGVTSKVKTPAELNRLNAERYGSK